ncbi:hypothetical protein CR513_60641, partial [Mucuna pruriens]
RNHSLKEELVAKTQILLIDPLPSLNHEGDEGQSMINFIDSKKFQSMGKYSSGKVFTYCGRIGHAIETCFGKHGFPPSSKPKGNRSFVNNVTSDGDDLDENIEGS